MNPASALSLDLTRSDLLRIFDLKYRREPELDWGPAQRLRFDYFNPDDVYEAVLDKLVVGGCRWADIGCGRDIFPSNPELAKELAARTEHLLGIDPSANVLENPFITEAYNGVMEDYPGEQLFDLVTMRMVAEHVERPDSVAARIARMLRPGGLCVVYTPNKWSPVSILARVIPFRFHHGIKAVIWGSEERDTFPVQFRMNTRRSLRNLFLRHGMAECHFRYLDDCRIFNSFRLLNLVELLVCRAFRLLRIAHPENCLLGIYRRTT